jgi:pre-mRNA-processing factor 40
MRARDDQRRQEKKTKRNADDFKYVLKKLEPPLTVSTTWDEVSSRSQYERVDS